MSFSILMLNNINAVQQVVLIVIDLNLKILNDNMLININLLSWYHSAYWNWQFAEQHQFIKIDVNQHPLLRQKWHGDFDTFYPHDEYLEGQEERKFLSLSSTMLKLWVNIKFLLVRREKVFVIIVDNVENLIQHKILVNVLIFLD